MTGRAPEPNPPAAARSGYPVNAQRSWMLMRLGYAATIANDLAQLSQLYGRMTSAPCHVNRR